MIRVGDQALLRFGVGNEQFRPLLFDVIRLTSPACYRLPAGVTRDSSTKSGRWSSCLPRWTGWPGIWLASPACSTSATSASAG